MGVKCMSSDVMIGTNNAYIPSKDSVSKAYTISDIINIALAYYAINEDPGEKDYAKKIIWGSINEWLETIGPLKYIPGLVEEVSVLVKKKLWDAEISEETLERIIVDTIVFKEEALKGSSPEVLSALSEVLAARAVDLIESLGGKIVPGTLTHEIIYGGENDPEDNLPSIITLIGLTLTLSTNP
jgi:hypothetical protein